MMRAAERLVVQRHCCYQKIQSEVSQWLSLRIVGEAALHRWARPRTTAAKAMLLFWALVGDGAAARQAPAVLFLSAHAVFQHDETSVKRPEVYPFEMSLNIELGITRGSKYRVDKTRAWAE